MSSSIPYAITGIQTVLAAALTGVTVSDASDLTDTTEVAPTDNIWRRVVVGGSPNEEGVITAAPLDWDRDWASIGRRSMDEEYVVSCYLDCVSGDEDMTALRLAVFDLLDDISAAVVTANLGHGIYEAAVHGRGQLIPVEDANGASAGTTFGVRCKARITNT